MYSTTMQSNQAKIESGAPLDLAGTWELSGMGEGATVGPIRAMVPGNIELDLQNAGVLPELFHGKNQLLLRPYEFMDWAYTRTFKVPKSFPAEADLKCLGIDCVADIEINGQKVGTCENAFISHEFKVDKVLKRGEENLIRVTIHSPILAVKDIPLDHQAFALWQNYESLNLRKPAHSYGWDICPRMMLGGIFRGITVVPRSANRFMSWFMDTHPYTTRERGVIACSFSLATSLKSWTEFTMEVKGHCGPHSFSHRQNFPFTAGSFFIEIDEPQFWNPAGYGQQNLYEVTVAVWHENQFLCSHHCTFGLRLVKVEIDENPENLKFQITVNGQKILAKGTNWVPTSAFHSQDSQRSPQLLALASELGCNIIRIWGGGIYEAPEFYDYCDRHGILVWQDFMISCGQVPQDDAFLEKLRIEAEAVVKELRQHPCLFLWCGDNEVDVFQYEQLRGVKPNLNRSTREVFPQVINRLSPSHCYLPSSPYVSPESEKLGRQQRDFPDQHPWGPRNYFKEPFYQRIKAPMISEIGFFGMPSEKSLRKFLPEKDLWPALNKNSDAWEAHAPHGYAFRFDTILRNAKEWFPEEYSNLADLIDASQFTQAEGFKFIIEKVRSQKWKHSGIIWWNLFDCWPQVSEALVDFYFEKKPAYGYVRRSQAQPLLLCLSEWDYIVAKGLGRTGHQLICCNDCLVPQFGHYRITDGDTGKLVLEGDFQVAENTSDIITHLDFSHTEHHLWLLEWQLSDGTLGANHYISGTPPFTLAEYRQWRPMIDALDVKIAWPRIACPSSLRESSPHRNSHC